MITRRWHLPPRIPFLAAAGVVVILAQACGGGSAGVDATPTAKPLPTLTPGSETPVSTPPVGSWGEGGGPPADTTPGAGPLGQAFRIGGASEEFAGFLGISLEQLESELGAEGATPASVAEAHGRTREDLKTFFLEQAQAQFSEAVAAGTMSQEDADSMVEDVTSRIDDIIDGNMPAAGALGPAFRIGGPSEELAAFLGITLEQLQSELGAEGATPASVAEAHGRTREDLKTFFVEQAQAQLSESVAAGTMSQEDADSMVEDLTSRIDSILDGQVPAGRPGQPPTVP